MRILINFTQVRPLRTGVGVYAERLVQELLPLLQPEDHLFVSAQDDDREVAKVVSECARARLLRIKSCVFRNRAALLLFEQLALPFILRQHRIDLVHSLHYTFPLLAGCSRIVTVHDTTFSLFPEAHTRDRRLMMPFFTKMAMRHAGGVCFVSESTRRDAERLFGTGDNVRVVTPHGVDMNVFAEGTPSEEVLSRLGLRQPYILYVGTIEPRKNLVRLVEAFGKVAERYPNHSLVIAGRLGWNYSAIVQAIECSAMSSRISRIGYISDADKIALLRGCDVLVYPSLYEGFGLPVLEGMAAGVPVITGNSSSLPEVAGNGAVLVDATSTAEIAKAIDLVLSDRRYRERLRQDGKKQASKFSWKRTAELTYAAYQEILSRCAPSNNLSA